MGCLGASVLPQPLRAKRAVRDTQPVTGSHPDLSYLLAAPSTSSSFHRWQCPALQVASHHAFCRALETGHLVPTEGLCSPRPPAPLGAPWRQPKPPPPAQHTRAVSAPQQPLRGRCTGAAVAGISRSAWQDSPSWHPCCRQGGCQGPAPPSPAAAKQSGPSDRSGGRQRA